MAYTLIFKSFFFCKLSIRRIISFDKPASSIVVSPYLKHISCASKSACFFSDFDNSGMTASIKLIGPSIRIPVSSPFFFKIVPLLLLVSLFILAISKAF